MINCFKLIVINYTVCQCCASVEVRYCVVFLTTLIVLHRIWAKSTPESSLYLMSQTVIDKLRNLSHYMGSLPIDFPFLCA